MSYSEQQSVLGRVMAQFGSKAYTEDHLQYRRVGVKGGDSAVGQTWEQAILNLQAKVKA